LCAAVTWSPLIGLPKWFPGEESSARSSIGNGPDLVPVLLPLHDGFCCCGRFGAIPHDGSGHPYFICVCAIWDAVGRVSSRLPSSWNVEWSSCDGDYLHVLCIMSVIEQFLLHWIVGMLFPVELFLLLWHPWLAVFFPRYTYEPKHCRVPRFISVTFLLVLGLSKRNAKTTVLKCAGVKWNMWDHQWSSRKLNKIADTKPGGQHIP
jgi:hypothetical protein